MSSSNEDHTDAFPDAQEDDEDNFDIDLLSLSEDPSTSRAEKKTEEAYSFEVLDTDQIVAHMVECIKEVNGVIQVLCRF
jgi:ariadne-1